MLEAIGFHGKHARRFFLRKRGVKSSEIVGGEGVRCGAGIAQDRLVFVRRIFGRAAEHQMFEQVRETAFARLDLVPRACPHHDKHGHQVGKFRRNGDEPETVGQILLHVLVRKDFRRCGDRCDAKEKIRDKSDSGNRHRGFRRMSGSVPSYSHADGNQLTARNAVLRGGRTGNGPW